MFLKNLGWDDFFARSFERFHEGGLVPGRVLSIQRGSSTVGTELGERRVSISGRLGGKDPALRPVVGDWVACLATGGALSRIEAVLPRKTLLSRKTPGRRTREQPVAANVDKVFLVAGLDKEFNLRRIERMLTMIYEAGAVPVVLLNKADLCANPEGTILRSQAVAPGVDVLLVSALRDEGIAGIREHLAPGRTVAFIGSSGVGKSSLINRLFGVEMLPTGTVRASDSRGRHTTTHRELFQHPDGGLLIDSPGIRELQLWASEESLEGSFPEVSDLALDCRFRDCSHDGEPGCAVLSEVQRGSLPAERLENFRKLQKEIRYLAVRQSVQLQHEQRRKWKVIHRAMRKRHREEQ